LPPISKNVPLPHPPGALCEYIDLMTGLSVSRSTMCRAIARIGVLPGKRGASRHRTRRVRQGGLVAGDGCSGGGAREAHIFVEECGTHTSHWHRSTGGRRPGASDCAFRCPSQAGQEHHAVLSSMTLSQGWGTVAGGGRADHSQGLRDLRGGGGARGEPTYTTDRGVMDNLGAHTPKRISGS
jgi:hypothetical protein